MKIVSACLAGVECRYDCESKPRQNIIKMVNEGKAIPICPEQLGGLSTPRAPSEEVGEIQTGRCVEGTGPEQRAVCPIFDPINRTGY